VWYVEIRELIRLGAITRKSVQCATELGGTDMMTYDLIPLDE
jgi:hypothetical protein